MPKRKRSKRRGRSALGYTLSFLAGALLTAGIAVWLIEEKPVSVKSLRKPDPLQKETRVQAPAAHPPPVVPSKGSKTKTAVRSRVAIVIDDLGEENHLSQELLDLDAPVTFSILPFAPYSKKLAAEAHVRGKEVILHLPMEPHGYPKTRPGEGVLLHEMTDQELRLQVSRDIGAIPHIAGVSNHMGSRMMEDSGRLRIILSELKRRGLFFLDSRTSSQSVGYETAQAIGLRAAGRTLFLDHSQAEGDIRENLQRLAQFSLSSGKAVGIGHPHPSTIRVLKEMIPKMKEKGIDLVPLSAVME